MTDREVSMLGVVTAIAWTVVGLMTVAMWATWLAGVKGVPLLIGLMLTPAATIAAVAQVRHGQVRACALLRVIGGLEQPRSPELHSLP